MIVTGVRRRLRRLRRWARRLVLRWLKSALWGLWSLRLTASAASGAASASQTPLLPTTGGWTKPVIYLGSKNVFAYEARMERREKSV